MLTLNGLSIALFLLIYIFIWLRLHKKKKSQGQYILFAVFLIYIAGVVDKVFFPIPVYSEDINRCRQFSAAIKYNIVPLKTFIEAFVDKHINFYQTGGNVLLFVPMGYLLPLINIKINKFRKVLITAFCCSLGIELIQLTASILYKFTYKRFDVDDIILNVLGSLIGYALLKLTSPILKKFTELQYEYSK